jgi:peroxiredoxin
MRPIFFTLPLGCLFACLGGLMYLSKLRAPVIDADFKPRHPVTAEMQAEVDDRALKAAPAFSLKDQEGKTVTLSELHKGKPLFLYFILDGCPCSIEAEPLFIRMYKHHGGAANFAGVIGSDVSIAKRWASDFETPYPVLSSADHKVMQEYGAPNSVYCAVISKGGKIVKMWAGYSAAMLEEVNALLAQEAGTEEKPFDPAYAPKELASGCSFKEGPPKS